MTRSDLTEPQRTLLDRAASTDDGFALCRTPGEMRVAKNLASMGLGDGSYAPTYFKINAAGLAPPLHAKS